MDNKKQIVVGSVISYATIFLNIILGLVYTPWILRTVGSSDYGLYTLATSFVALFLLDFGMSAAVTRFVSNFRAQKKQDCINSFVGMTIKFYAVICSITAAIMVVMYFFLPEIYASLTSEEIARFKIVFIITAFFVTICFPVNVFNGILNAYEQYIYLKGSDILNKLGSVIVTIIALMIYPNIYVLVLILGIFNLLTFALKFVLVRIKTPVRISFAKHEEVTFRSVFSFSMWSTANTVSQQLTTNLMPTVLGMVANTLSITIYGFARTIEGYVYSISQGINGFFMPSVSREIVDEADASKVLPLMKKVGRINLSIMAILFIGLFTMGSEFVRLWVGDEYSILYYCFLLLTVHYVFQAPEQIAATSVTVQNKIKYTSMINLVTSVLGLIVAYFVASKAGVVGVCTVICIVNFAKYFAYNYVYYKIMNINIFSFFKDCYLKMLPALVISSVLSVFVVKIIPLSGVGFLGWSFFFVKALCVCVIYLICMWLLGWNKDEKELILLLLLVKKR